MLLDSQLALLQFVAGYSQEPNPPEGIQDGGSRRQTRGPVLPSLHKKRKEAKMRPINSAITFIPPAAARTSPHQK